MTLPAPRQFVLHSRHADGDHILPWLATLALLTVVWLLSPGADAMTPALLLGTALVIRLIFLSMPTGYDTYRCLGSTATTA